MVKQGRKLVTPRLRFPDFRVSEGWSTARMDRLYSFGRNNILSRDKLNYVDGSAKNIHYGDIHTKFPATFDVSREQVPFVNQSEALPEFASGDYCVESDLVFADASEDMNDVGKTIEIVRLHGEQVLAGQHTILARQRGRSLVTGFGAYLFGSGLMRGRIKKEAQGTKVFQISAARLGGIDVTYPSSEAEQQKIADCLTSLDEMIAAQGRKVQTLKAHKRGLMQQLFPREGETRPRLRFPEFRDAPEWKQEALGETTDVLMCKRIFASETNTVAGVPFYKIGTLGASPDAYISKELFEDYKARYSFPRVGEILITCSGTVGKCLRYDGGDAYFQDSNIVWIDNPAGAIINDFLFALISNVDWSKLNSTTITRIYGPDLRALPIKYPKDAAEQQRIADCLASLDTRITAETARLAALKTHKQGLMQQLFPAPEAMNA